ncbi:MAG: type VI secretion protein [Proteobacteria bacterium]|nr:type VI secretion protein [Pseudomonadota bacterium]
MSHLMRRLCLLAGLLLPGLPQAAEPGHACAVVASPAERLACYDKAFPPSPEVHAAAIRQAEQSFGMQRNEPVLANPGQPAAELDPDRIESRVSKVAYTGGSRAITLENGQVWALTEATSRGNVNEGDTVLVRKGVMGNYMLVTAAGVGLRVRRVR